MGFILIETLLFDLNSKIHRIYTHPACDMKELSYSVSRINKIGDVSTSSYSKLQILRKYIRYRLLYVKRYRRLNRILKLSEERKDISLSTFCKYYCYCEAISLYPSQSNINYRYRRKLFINLLLRDFPQNPDPHISIQTKH